MEMRASVPYVNVTPEFAATLVNNMDLSHLSKKYVNAGAEIADRLKRGAVDETDGLIKIDETGTIVKGMEYLLGVMKSQVPCLMKIESGVKMNAFMNMEVRNSIADNARYMNPDFNINWTKTVAAVNVLALFANKKMPADIVINTIKAHKTLVDQCAQYFTSYPGIDSSVFHAAALLYLYDASNDEVRNRLTLWCKYVGTGNVDGKIEDDAVDLSNATRTAIYAQSGPFAMLKRKTRENKKRAVLQILFSMTSYGYAHITADETQYADVVAGVTKDVEDFFDAAGADGVMQTVTPRDIREMVLNLNKADNAAKKEGEAASPKGKKEQSAQATKSKAGKAQEAKSGSKKGTPAAGKKVIGTTRVKKKENPAA